MALRVIREHLAAICNKEDYEQGVGKEYGTLYVVSDDFQIYKRTNLAGGGHCLLKTNELPKFEGNHSDQIQEVIDFLPGGKVPFNLLSQVASFFKQVMEVNFGGATSRAGDNCEAFAHILWNKEEKKYEIGIPTQKVGRASVTHVFDDVDHSKHVMVVDIHSHNTMGAFFSGTDDRSDKEGIWFAVVIGQLDKPVPAVKIRFTNFGIFKERHIEDIFDPDPETEYNLILDPLLVKQEWLDKVEGTYTSTFSLGRTEYGSGYRGARTSSERGPSSYDKHLYDMYSQFDFEDMEGFGDSYPWGIGMDPSGTVSRHGRTVSAKKPRVGNKPYNRYERAEEDAIEAIYELSYPSNKLLLHNIAEALKEVIVGGINKMHKKDASFLFEIADIFAEDYAEIHEGHPLKRFMASSMLGSLLKNCDWETHQNLFYEFMNALQDGYEDNEQINLALDYLEQSLEEMSAEQFHRLRTLPDVQVLDQPTDQ